jgi:hypothetical protein
MENLTFFTLPGFETSIVQPVASRYTDYVTAAHVHLQSPLQTLTLWEY